MAKIKIWELKPDDLPLRIRLQGQWGTRDYVLIRTKQGKLLLNKTIEDTTKENE